MNSSEWDWLGIFAGSLTTISFIPQVIKVWRSRSAQDLSLSMFLIFFSGTVGWLCYGVAIKSTPVILSNTVTALLAFSILMMKLRFGRRL